MRWLVVVCALEFFSPGTLAPEHAVVLLPGWHGVAGMLAPLAEDLAAQLKDAVVLVPEVDATSRLHLQAEEAFQQLRRLAGRQPSLTRYSLVGHSAGALVGRSLAKKVADAGLALEPTAYVSLFAPHLGLRGGIALLGGCLELGCLGYADAALDDVRDSRVLAGLDDARHTEAVARFARRSFYGSAQDWLFSFESAALTSAQPPAEPSPDFPLLALREVGDASGPEDAAGPRGLRGLPSRRFAADWSVLRPDRHGLADWPPALRKELARHVASGFAELGLVRLGRGRPCAGLDACAPGLVCLEASHPWSPEAMEPQRRCTPPPIDLCGPLQREQAQEDHEVVRAATRQSLRSCSSLELMVRQALVGYTVVLTSSGGGGHLAAAVSLHQQQAEQQRRQTEEALRLARTWAAELGATPVQALERALLDEPRVRSVDMMQSPCAEVFGINVGGAMARAWNGAQRKGRLGWLKGMLSLQPLTETLFGSQCEEFVRTLVTTDLGGAAELLSTQPLQLSSILKAAQTTGSGLAHVYMTDLPTKSAVHFFRPLQRLQAQLANRVRLHSVAPSGALALDATQQREKLAELAGLTPFQVVVEPFLPVGPQFTDGALPRPGTALPLVLQAQLPEERAFLGDGALQIGPDDEVTLVMLGSQPTLQAVREYAAAALALAPAPFQRWVFLACGTPKVPAYAQLYADVLALVEAPREEPPPGRVAARVVPFTGQDAKLLLGRADVTVTRSGGMTAGELLALSRRGDTKRVWLHVEEVPGVAALASRRLAAQADPRADAAPSAAWREASFKLGMVDWEAGNARYLVQALGAGAVAPRQLPRVFGAKAPPPFALDWSEFLAARGLAPALAGFVGASGLPQPCLDLQRQCRHLGAAPLPQRALALRGDQCLRAAAALGPQAVAVGAAGTARRVQARDEPVLSAALRCGDAGTVLAAVADDPLMDLPDAALGMAALPHLLAEPEAACGGERLACGPYDVLRVALPI